MPAASSGSPVVTEAQGRRWIFGSFLLCPCHLPITLAVIGSLAGGTVLGGLLRDHALLAGAVVTLGWMIGTANGFRLVRHAQRGTCPIPLRTRLRRRGDARRPAQASMPNRDSPKASMALPRRKA